VTLKPQKNSNAKTHPAASSSTLDRPPDDASEVVAEGDEAKLQAHLDAQIEVLTRWLDQAEVSNRPAYRKAVERKQLLERELRLSRLREGLARAPSLQIPSKLAPEPAVQPTPTGDAPKGFDRIGRKESDLSQYFDAADLTERQRECASMKYEYGLALAEIASRLNAHHSTIQEALKAVEKRLQRDEKFKQALKRRAAHRGSHDESD
jgi:predicted DNA-binding protein YlxM (UPF0122 family)